MYLYGTFEENAKEEIKRAVCICNPIHVPCSRI